MDTRRSLEACEEACEATEEATEGEAEGAAEGVEDASRDAESESFVDGIAKDVGRANQPDAMGLRLLASAGGGSSGGGAAMAADAAGRGASGARSASGDGGAEPSASSADAELSRSHSASSRRNSSRLERCEARVWLTAVPRRAGMATRRSSKAGLAPPAVGSAAGSRFFLGERGGASLTAEALVVAALSAHCACSWATRARSVSMSLISSACRASSDCADGATERGLAPGGVAPLWWSPRS